MNQSINPIYNPATEADLLPREFVLGFLKRFADRQSRLQIVRGGCVFMICLAVCTGSIVLVDGVGKLSDYWRWAFSCAAYLISLLAGMQMGLTALWRRPTHERVAHAIESMHPAFRESLVSSVGLRKSDGSVRHGSSALVSEIERSVADELVDLSIHEILPWSAIVRALSTSGFLVAIILVACCFPEWKFPQRLARAMIPFVDIAVPTHVRIEILEPNPSPRMVPSEQTMRFSIEVTGGSPYEAMLELQESSVASQPSTNPSRRLKMVMDNVSPRRFSVSATIGDSETRFRFLAGDGRTAFQTITPIQRPKPIAFHAVIAPPLYSRGPVKVQSGSRGDIQVLAGSSVELEIDSNMQLNRAELEIQFEASGRKEIFVLRRIEPDAKRPLVAGSLARYAVGFEVDESFRFQVRLVSELEYQGNRIENSYSPYYKVEAIEDLPADVDWAATPGTYWAQPPVANASFIVSAVDVITLAGSVRDNMPLEQISQELSVDGGDWQEVPIETEWIVANQNEFGVSSVAVAKEPGFKANASWKWDFSNLKTQVAETVSLRLVAVDRKGNRSYSTPVQFSIASVGFDRNRHRSLSRRAELIEPLRALVDELVPKRERGKQLVALIKDAGQTNEQKQAALRELRDSAKKAIEHTMATRKVGHAIIADLRQYADQNEVELTIRAVSHIERDFLKFIEFYTSDDNLALTEDVSSHSDEWHTKELKSRVQQLALAVERAGEQSKRTLEIYSQFLGLEYQAALTKDLTALMEHLKREIYSTSQADFATLSRANQISDQYLDGALKLTGDMESKVPKSIRDRIPSLYRWADQTRSETRDLVQADEDQPSIEKLRSRMERTLNELRQMRWGYNLGGNLIPSTIEGRRALLIQSGSLWPCFENVIARMKQGVEIALDKNLATNQVQFRLKRVLQELRGPLFEATEQLLDRRDIHQTRIDADPLFANDIGMTHRAWSAVLERAISNPTESKESLSELGEIARAFRVLEAAHESVESRIAVQTLRPLEQHEWNTLDGQWMHPKQWDCVQPRLEVACQWMRNAGFASPVVDKYTALLGSEAVQSIVKKLNPRREANNSYIVSAADDLQELLGLWAIADAAAKPAIDTARAFLERYSPSISELAKNASEATRELQKRTEMLSEINRDTGAGNLEENERNFEQVLQQQLEAASQTSKLQDALVDMARTKDLLEETQREAARDSDRALKLLDATAIPMQQAIHEALSAFPLFTESSPLESTEKFKEAIRRESVTVKVLDEVAKHFAELEQLAGSGGALQEEKVKQSRAELERLTDSAIEEYSQSRNPLELRDESSGYEEAERLAELADSDPQQLLEKLEQELKSNEAMRSELSDISRATAQAVAMELRNSASMEKSLADRVENSDARLLGEKRWVLEDLKAIAEQSDRIAARLMNKAADVANRAGKPVESQSLDGTARELRNAASQAKPLTEQTPREGVQQSIAGLSNIVSESQGRVAAAEQAMQPWVDQARAKDEKRRQDDRNEMRNLQNQIREEVNKQAREMVQEAKQRLEKAKKRSEPISDQLSKATRHKADAKKALDKAPNDPETQKRFRLTSIQEEQTLTKKLAAERMVEQASHSLGNAEMRQVTLEQSNTVNVDKPNPQAALALEQIRATQKQLSDLQQQLMSLSQAAAELTYPSSVSSDLLNQEQQQREVQGDVKHSAHELSRAARHELRLGNETGSSMLMQNAKQIEQRSDRSLDGIKNRLSKATENASLAEMNQAIENKDVEITMPFERPSTLSIQDDLMKSGEDLQSLAVQLEEYIGTGSVDESNAKQSSGQPKVKPDSGNEQTPGSSQENAKQPIGSRRLARMLDELDRSLNSSTTQAGGDEQESKDSDANKSSRSSKAEQVANDARESKTSRDDGDRNGSRSSFEQSIREATQRLSGAMNQERLSQRSASLDKQSQEGRESNQQQAQFSGQGMPTLEDASSFVLPRRLSEVNREWGQLRSQRAEDVIEGRRDDYDPEFNDAIKAYYKAIGNRLLTK